MIAAAITALKDLVSPGFRGILLKSLAFTLALFAALFLAVEHAVAALTAFRWAWLDTLVEWSAGIALIAAFFFLIVPVSAIFAGLFLDRIAALTEQRHYPSDAPGRELPVFTGLIAGLQFAALALLVAVALFPFIFIAIGAVLLPAANAYLISREYFMLAAARHEGLDGAKALRRENALWLWIAGLVPALLALVPVVNFATPVFAASYFVHVYKRLARQSSAPREGQRAGSPQALT